ncbi:MAG: formyltransferase family protein [Salibacteraceae bacterium]
MRYFLIGSKELSCLILDRLLEAGEEVLGVFTRDHEPGMKVWHELGHRSLASYARKHNIPVYENINVNSNEARKILTEANLDIILSCFWSQMFREPTLNIPKLGIYNFHTAYLPKNRGSRPIPWALIKGESQTGITVHRMMTGVDNGPVLAQKKVAITAEDTGKTLYEKVTQAGGELAKQVIAELASNAFKLTLQDEDQATYQPRGEPYGRQINPYWSDDEKDRFRRAFDFPPFSSALDAPNPALNGKKPRLYVLLGFDCDRPRGIYAFSEEGQKVARRKFNSLNAVKEDLDQLGIDRSYFISGQFLESMTTLFGREEMISVFISAKCNVELGDHTYHHDILKPLPTRPDKIALTAQQLKKEIRLNTQTFEKILGDGIKSRGLRSPLGYFEGMKGQYKSIDVMKREGMRYISTDLRDENHSLHPKLFDNSGKPRQPYRYENGLLEIPAIGWQDTVFSGLSTTPLFEEHPKSFEEIIVYFEQLFNDAQKIVQSNKRDFFLGLTLHPLDNSYYNENRQFFPAIKNLLQKLEGDFLTYGEVCDHYNSTYD